jgi:hypothetical protein
MQTVVHMPIVKVCVEQRTCDTLQLHEYTQVVLPLIKAVGKQGTEMRYRPSTLARFFQDLLASAQHSTLQP